MVELALTVVLLLVMVFGLIEASRWFFALNAIQNAAREAARYASTGQAPPPGCAASYEDCRVQAIADVAYARARTSLQMNPPILLENCTGPTGPCTKAGALIVAVRGSTCIDDIPSCAPPTNSEYPGVPRGRVRVILRYNHPVANPLFSSWLPTLPVTGSYEIVNEPWKGGGMVVPPALGASPLFPTLDSDGDGWSDWDEVHIWGTLPGNADTDGDGVNDPVDSAPNNPYVH
jgi:hypothetical protein